MLPQILRCLEWIPFEFHQESLILRCLERITRNSFPNTVSEGSGTRNAVTVRMHFDKLFSLETTAARTLLLRPKVHHPLRRSLPFGFLLCRHGTKPLPCKYVAIVDLRSLHEIRQPAHFAVADLENSHVNPIDFAFMTLKRVFIEESHYFCKLARIEQG